MTEKTRKQDRELPTKEKEEKTHVAAAVLWKRFCVEKQWGDTTAAMEGVVKDLRLEAMNLW